MRQWFKKAKNPVVAPEPLPEKSAPAVIEESGGALADRVPPAPAVAAGATAEAGAAATPQPSARTLFNQLLNGLYDAAVITDLKGHVVNANGRLTSALGFESDAIWDWHISRLIPGISNTLLIQINEGLDDERYVLLEARCMREDETSFPAEIAISHVAITADNNLLFCIRNIERRHAIIKELRAASRLLNYLPGAALSCDQAGKVVVANRAMARMLGIEEAALLSGQSFTDIWREAQAPDVIKRALMGETVKQPATVVNTRGKRLQIIISVAPDIDQHKRVAGLLVSFTPAAVVSLGATAK